MICKRGYLEKSKAISIQKNHYKNENIKTPNYEYSLNENLFDPTKSSPPNEFIIKLHMRLSLYNSCQKKEDNSTKK